MRRDVDRLSGRGGRGRVRRPRPQPAARPAAPAPTLIAKDGESLAIAAYLSTNDIEDAGGIAAEEVKALAEASPLDVAEGGFAQGFNETNDQTRKDLTKAELIAFPVLALLLLFVFRGVVAASIPLLIGGISIVGTLLRAAGDVGLRRHLAVRAQHRHRAQPRPRRRLRAADGLALPRGDRCRRRHRARRTGARCTTAGRTALFSGLTVAAAMAALIFMPQRFLYSMAVAGASVAVLSSLIAILVVPSLLRLLGTRIDALSIRRGPAVSDTSDGWYRLARGVMRRPLAVALGSGALLLAAAAPLLWTTLTGPSAEAVPPNQPSYDAYRYLEAHYPRDVTEAVTVAVDGRAGTAQLAAFQRRIEAVGDVVRGTPFLRASERRRLRQLRPRRAGPLRRLPGRGAARSATSPRRARATVLVSGNSARFIDQKQSLLEHAPLVVAIICLTTLIVLFLLTGSVLLPLKTLLMNSLTLGATLGILVLAFQEGWLDSPLDYTGPAAIEVTSLVFLFAVIFGLATDYAVLVMARIKERHDLGDSNEEAVAVGIGRTGRVITAAAVAIAVVFLAFGVSSRLLRQADRDRHGLRRDDRRDDRPRPARPLADAPLRRVELVGAETAAPHLPAPRLLRGARRAAQLWRLFRVPVTHNSPRRAARAIDHITHI